MTFKTIGDAVLLRNRLIDALERGALEKDAEKKRKLLSITVAGGGCTGVEVAGRDRPVHQRHSPQRLS